MTEGDTDSFISTIRQRGEVKSGTGKTKPPARLSAEGARLLLNELSARQLELESQNAELRRTVAELKASQAHYTDLYDRAPAGDVMLNAQGLITEANPAAAELFGAVRSALVNQPLTRFILPDDMATYYLHRKKLVETRARQSFEIRLSRHDGTWFWAHLEATVTPDAHGAPICRAAISDISACVRSERQQAEAALRASEARYREMAEKNARLLEKTRQEADTETLRLREANHRVKNNLAAIITLLRLDLRYVESDRESPYRSLVEDLIGRIQSLALVHSLLTANDGEPLELARLAEYVMKVAPAMLPRRQPVQLEIAPSAVLLSPKQASAVGLILNELATNSLKHGLCQDETMSLRLNTHAAGDEVDLEYRDNGPGYPETTLQGKRESVGLFIVKTLAEHDLEGKIAFSNDHGAVARLRFALARSLPAASPSAVPLFQTQP